MRARVRAWLRALLGWGWRQPPAWRHTPTVVEAPRLDCGHQPGGAIHTCMHCRHTRCYACHYAHQAACHDQLMAVADAVAVPAHRPKPLRDTVIAHVTFDVLGEHAHSAANLRYRRDDPYAVTAHFGIPDGDAPIVWRFARELLHTAAIDRMPAGLADVHWYERDATTLILGLRSHEGEIALAVRHADVAAFLRDTYTVVPRGEEAEHLGIDAELVNLFAAGEVL